LECRIQFERVVFQLVVSHELVEANEHVPGLKPLLPFPDLLLQEVRVTRPLVDIEESHVILEHLGIRLLPEGLFAFAKEVVQQGGDAVGKSIRVQVVMERVVAIRGVET